MKEIQTLTTRLNAVFDNSGKTIQEFSAIIGMDRGQFGKVLNDKMGITLKQLMEISSHFNVRIGWLLEGEEPMAKNEKSGPLQAPDPKLVTQVMSEMDALKASLYRLSESLASHSEEENEDQGAAYQPFQEDKSRTAGKQ